jgi:hypothetical protein
VRQIQFDDMVAKRKADLLRAESSRPSFEERDFACYSEAQIRKLAFDIRSLFLTDRAKHLAICTRCQIRLKSWTRLAESFDQYVFKHNGQVDA